MTFEEMMQEHLKALKRRGRCQATIDNRRCHLRQLGEFLAGREATLPSCANGPTPWRLEASRSAVSGAAL